MKHKESHIAACDACGATGLYVGMAEKQGAAVVCHFCKGTGQRTVTFEWEDFEGRNRKPGVTHVYACNPGIICGPKVVAGGVPVKDWEKNPAAPFRKGAEMRDHTCPAWWYQAADYKKKPDWKECEWGLRFADCRSFSTKADCWERWDREHKK